VGQDNLYDYHEGDYTLIAAVTAEDLTSASVSQSIANSQFRAGSLLGLGGAPIYRQTRVTPDGGQFVFMSNSAALAESVAGYDNRDAVTGDPVFEVYRYDAEGGGVSCVSCHPAGIRPKGVLSRVPYSPLDWEFTNFPNVRVGSSIPTWEHDNHASRVVSDDGGRVFFHSDQALVDGDTNGVKDLYQWRAEGAGGCEASQPSYGAQNGGCVDLISTGKDGAKSEFVDATPTGDEVYFTTDESIDPRDPGSRDIYVAKIGGGFAPPSPPVQGCGVLDGACQGTGAGPATADPARSTAPTPTPEGNVSPRARMQLSVAVASGAKARRLAARRGVVRVAVRTNGPGVVRARARARIGSR
jgi:hypothetical protein